MVHVSFIDFISDACVGREGVGARASDAFMSGAWPLKRLPWFLNGVGLISQWSVFFLNGSSTSRWPSKIWWPSLSRWHLLVGFTDGNVMAPRARSTQWWSDPVSGGLIRSVMA
jgi:hypothetical protein